MGKPIVEMSDVKSNLSPAATKEKDLALLHFCNNVRLVTSPDGNIHALVTYPRQSSLAAG